MGYFHVRRKTITACRVLSATMRERQREENSIQEPLSIPVNPHVVVSLSVSLSLWVGDKLDQGSSMNVHDSRTEDDHHIHSALTTLSVHSYFRSPNSSCSLPAISPLVLWSRDLQNNPLALRMHLEELQCRASILARLGSLRPQSGRDS